MTSINSPRIDLRLRAPAPSAYPRRHLMRRTAFLFSTIAFSLSAFAADDSPNLEVIHRIKAEAFENSHVMDHLFYLTDVNGPRLTGSPGFVSAAKWAQSEFEKIGLS